MLMSSSLKIIPKSKFNDQNVKTIIIIELGCGKIL